jgi:hypothetical protein
VTSVEEKRFLTSSTWQERIMKNGKNDRKNILSTSFSPIIHKWVICGELDIQLFMPRFASFIFHFAFVAASVAVDVDVNEVRRNGCARRC